MGLTPRRDQAEWIVQLTRGHQHRGREAWFGLDGRRSEQGFQNAIDLTLPIHYIELGSGPTGLAEHGQYRDDAGR